MKDKTISAGKGKCFSVSAFSGGLHQANFDEKLPDGALTRCRNLWWEEGALRTRPGLCLGGSVNAAGENRISMPPEVRIGEDVFLEGEREYRYLLELQYTEPNHHAVVCLYRLYCDGEWARLCHKTFPNPDVTETAYPLPYHGFLTCGPAVKGAGVFVFLDNGCILELGVSQSSFLELVDEDFYKPLVLIDGKPSESMVDAPLTGTAYEDYNLLTDSYRAAYTSDGAGIYYVLPKKQVQGDVTVSLTLPDGTYGEATLAGPGTTFAMFSGINASVELYRTSGMFRILQSGSYVIGRGRDHNVTVTVSGTESRRADICHMQQAVWFGGSGSGLFAGGRLFLAGSLKDPNLLCWSASDRPLYFPAQNRITVGSTGQRITALAKQDQLLVIFKEAELYAAENPSAEDLREETELGNPVSTSRLTLRQLHPGIGCRQPGTIRLCGNRLFWMDGKGRVCGLFSASPYRETNIRVVSGPCGDALRTEMKDSAFGVEYRGRYLLCLDRSVYCLDYTRSDFSEGSGVRWYRWELPLPGGEENSDLDAPRYFAGTEFGEECLLLARIAVTDPALEQPQPHTLAFRLEGEKDCPADVTGRQTGQPIPFSLMTQQYDMGTPARRKTFSRAALCVSGKNISITVSWITERKEKPEHSQRIFLRDNRTDPICLRPAVRRKTSLGIAMEGSGPFALEGLELEYQLMGGVR